MRKRLNARRSPYQRMLKGLEAGAVLTRKNSVEAIDVCTTHCSKFQKTNAEILTTTNSFSKAKVSKTHPWFIYILECQDGSFYTGITTDIERRLKMHNDGKGARFTRSRRPVKVIYQESLSTRAQALIREYKIKALSRIKKQALVAILTRKRFSV